jgi:peptide/nickel transport system permease protein
MSPGQNTSRPPSYYAWLRLKKNRPALFSLLFIALCVFIAISGYAFLPDKTPQANDQHIELETLHPGTSVTMLRVNRQQPIEKSNFFSWLLSGQSSSYIDIPVSAYQISGDSIFYQPYGMAGGMPERLSLREVTANANASAKELQAEVTARLIIKKTFWLGTDKYGRDMLSRLLLGTRISLSVGFIAVLISLIIGITLGALAGFFRGWIDDVILWLVNVVWSIPTFLLVMAVSLVLGRGFWQVFIAVGLTMWVEVARMVRGQILFARELEYVQAARALGFRHWRTIIKHILPNIVGPVLVIAAANFASAIVLEAGLSFLGLGVQPPTPSWGVMINEHYSYIVADAAYLAILPGLAISLLVLAFNLLGSGLRDAIDVRMK